MDPKRPETFNPQSLLKMGQGLKDPWARREAWRYTGPFTRAQRFRGLFPGFGIATVAFAGYCAFEYAFLKDDHAHGHAEEHGEGH